MNGAEIETFLRKHCSDLFMGVYSSDQLPKTINPPKLLVCNTDTSDLPGEHWIAIYIGSDGHGEFMDSFGREPGQPFLDFMNKHSKIWLYNDKQLQSVISSYCGNYVLFYCFRRSRGMNLNAIINLFSNDTALNDHLVHKFVCKNKRK
jgi:hypothetical protein